MRVHGLRRTHDSSEQDGAVIAQASNRARPSKLVMTYQAALQHGITARLKHEAGDFEPRNKSSARTWSSHTYEVFPKTQKHVRTTTPAMDTKRYSSIWKLVTRDLVKSGGVGPTDAYA